MAAETKDANFWVFCGSAGPSLLTVAPSANVEALKQAIKALFQLSGPVGELDVRTSRDALPLKPSLPIQKLLQQTQLDRDDEDGNVVLYANEHADRGPFVLSAGAKERIWLSLLRINAYDAQGKRSTATALIFDIDQTSLYIMAPLHFVAGCRASCSSEFQDEIDILAQGEKKDDGFCSMNNFQVVQVSADGGECDVTTFKVTPEICWQARADQDFAIFQIPLDDSWDCSVQGQAERDLEPGSKHNEELLPLATQLCIPFFRFSISPAEPVCVLGFSETTAGRSIASATVSAVRRVDILLQNLSCNGFSGGLVVTSTGHVVGVLASPLGSSAFGSAYRVDGYPLRPSSKVRKTRPWLSTQ